MMVSGSGEVGLGKRTSKPKTASAKHGVWASHLSHDIHGGTDNHDYFTLAALLGSFRDVVRELGGNHTRLLEEAGISPWTLSHPSAKIPLDTMGQLLENTAAKLSCPDLGMRLAEKQSMRPIMQPLEQLFCAAPTLRDSFESCSRHIDAFNSGLIMDLDDQFIDRLTLLHFEMRDGLSLFPQLIEQLVLLTHNSGVWLSAGFARSRTVWFSHLNISPPVAYARRFNTIVKFGQEYDGLFFSADDLRKSVVDCNAERFESEAHIIAEQFPTCRKGIDIKVRQAVFRMLTRSESCTRQNIASLLGLQERTLNRRLSKKGTSFESIRDEVRRNLAFRYLARADLPLTEIAGRLGYSELAVLSRSCKRWFGISPRQFRQDLLSTRPETVCRRKSNAA